MGVSERTALVRRALTIRSLVDAYQPAFNAKINADPSWTPKNLPATRTIA